MDCAKCEARDLEPGEACDCQDEHMDMLREEEEMLREQSADWVLFSEVLPMTREEFYDYFLEAYDIGDVVDPDDQEVILAATVVALDKKLQEALKEIQRLKGPHL
jgi:hypothetical protein